MRLPNNRIKMVDDDGYFTREAIQLLAEIAAGRIEQYTNAQILDKSHALNRKHRFTGKIIYDTTNDDLLFSKGNAATDDWGVITHSTITPV